MEIITLNILKVRAREREKGAERETHTHTQIGKDYFGLHLRLAEKKKKHLTLKKNEKKGERQYMT